MFKDLFNNNTSKKGINANLGDDLKTDEDYGANNLNGTIGKNKSMKKIASKKDLKNKFSSSAAVNEDDFDFEDRVEDDDQLKREKIMVGIELGQDAVEE